MHVQTKESARLQAILREAGATVDAPESVNLQFKMLTDARVACLLSDAERICSWSGSDSVLRKFAKHVRKSLRSYVIYMFIGVQKRNEKFGYM